MALKMYRFNVINTINKLSSSKMLVWASRLHSDQSRIASSFRPPVLCHRSRSENAPNLLHQSIQSRQSSGGLTTAIWQRLGFAGPLKYRKYILKRSALRLYLCCMELPDYNSMMQELCLQDTFNSWFRLVGLHIWLSMVRLSAEGREGKFMRDEMIKSLWVDVSKKSRKLGTSFSSRSEGVQDLADQFKASLYAYDEGLMSDDYVLAGALWRNLFDKDCAHVVHLELMVEYVRKQLSHMDKLDSDTLLYGGLLELLPLHETQDNADRRKQILNEIATRV